MTTPSLCLRSALLPALCTGFGQSVAAQTPPKPRPFDTASGILFACVPAPGVAWTTKLCAHIAAEVKKRAAAAKMPVAPVEITADIATRKFGPADGFDGDKAIRMRWTCTESDKKGEVTLALKSNVVYEPAQKDFPNQTLVPGRRIPMNFLAMQVIFEPRASSRDHLDYTGRLLDSFFEFGDRKPQRP